MVNKTDLASLRQYAQSMGRVLSIYLDVDQSKPSNLNRGFLLALNEQLRKLNAFEEESERRDFEASMLQLQQFMSKYVPASRGLVIFAKSTGSFWLKEIDVPTTTEVRWSSQAYLTPLIEAMDEYQRYAVVLLDRSHAKLFTVTLGRIEKYAELFGSDFLRHLKSSGRDHAFSQPALQRKADEHVHWHIKNVVGALEDLVAVVPFERIVLAGTFESTAELQRSLPKWLKVRVIGAVALPMSADEAEILAVTGSIEHSAERGFELARVERLLDGSGANGRATADVAETLRAINEKRVRELMYSEGEAIAGGRCPRCSAVFAPADFLCEYCGVAVEPTDNVIEAAASRALAAGASIEQVRGDAAGRLKAAGGMGAFLRY